MQKVLFWRGFELFPYTICSKPLPNNTFGTFDHTCLQMSMGLKAYTFKAHRHLEARWAKSAKSALWERFLGRLYIGIHRFLSTF